MRTTLYNHRLTEVLRSAGLTVKLSNFSGVWINKQSIFQKFGNGIDNGCAAMLDYVNQSLPGTVKARLSGYETTEYLLIEVHTN
jgi:hypothetical protein